MESKFYSTLYNKLNISIWHIPFIISVITHFRVRRDNLNLTVKMS